MKKRCLLGLILALLFLLCAVAQAESGGGLLTNPGFEDISDNGLPAGWAIGMWYETGASNVRLDADAYEGAYSALVENINPNDARFEQTVAVEPNSYYRIACRVKALHCGEGANGAGISIEDTFVYSELLQDTAGEWKYVELYGRTGENQNEITVLARVGGYGSENTGTAWFDAFEMEKLDAVPADVFVHDLTIPEASSASTGATDEERDALPMTLALAFLFLLVAGVLAFYISSGKLRVHFDGPVVTRYLIVMLAGAFVIRLIVSVLIRGYEVDMNCFESWAATMAEVGPSMFYETTSFCDYPPGYMYILWLTGSVIRGLSLGSPITWLVIKLPPMLMDICAALVIYQVSKKHVGQTTAALLATLYAFNPATAVNSAAWGQVDAVLAVLLALAISEAVKRRWTIALPAFALAALIKPQALMVAPLGLFVVVLEGIRLLREKEKPWNLIIGFAGAVALFVVLILPFAANKADPVLWLMDKYTGTMGSYPYITVNACNLYTLMGMNWRAMSEVPVASAIAWALFGLSYVYAGFLYFKSKDPKKLFLVCATLLTLVFAFGAMMHERYAFPALILLVIAYAIDRDSRLMAAILVLSFTQFLNTALVLQNEHLISSMNAINYTISALNIAAALWLAWTAFDLCVRGRTMGITRVYKPLTAATRVVETNPAAERLFRPKEYRMRLRQIDYLLMIGLTVVYAAFAFLNLGSTAAPQTSWTSSESGEQITFDLGEERTFHLTYYGGICDTSFTVELSDDGERWGDPGLAQYDQGQIFRWLWYVPGARDEENEWAAQESGQPMQTARYVRLTAEWQGLILSEVAFLDENGEALPIVSVRSAGGDEQEMSDPKYLIDEQSTVPPYPSYFNSTYFDEIYHARTAYEHLEGEHAYEYTHPPLGKVLIMLGIQLFGMTPFGWRFVGTLFGALMIPLMYLLAKQLTRRTSLSFIAAFLMAVDCMHFTQTRIATIDTYGVFFIMLMYLFMLRYTQMSFHTTPLWRTLIPLGLSGVSMGLAIASKWIGIYAGLGLAVLLLMSLLRRFKEYQFVRKNMEELDGDQRKIAQRVLKLFPKNLSITVGFCVLMFIIVPLLIYFFSYYLHLVPDGNWSVKGVVDMQKSMLSYHSSLKDDHWFQSPWYEWPLIVKPMWYFSGDKYLPDGYVSSISVMGNPAVWWGGLIALFFVAFRFILIDYKDRRYQFVLVGFLAQYLPWVLVPRSTFIYHYFASVPFIILATILLFDFVRIRYPKAYKISAIAFCGVALVLFAAFYPLMSGTPVPREYAMYLRWFNWYNF